MELSRTHHEHRPLTLDGLRLSTIPLESLSRNEKGTVTKQQTEIPLQINGHAFGLYVELTQKTGRTNTSRGYAFVVYHLDGEIIIPNILAEATFIERDDHIDVMTSVQKEHDHPLLVGTGLAIYKKVLELIEDLSKTSKKELVHIVTINRSISKREKHLTTERWLALFRPVLEERGYIQIDEEHWQKTYQNGALVNTRTPLEEIG